MTKQELESALDEVLDAFRLDTDRINDYSNKPVTEGDLKDLAKQTFYALNGFKVKILTYFE